MTDELITTTRVKMSRALDVTREDLSSIRSGRATPALVENIVIGAYGGSQRLKVKELATLTTVDAKTIVIAPFDPSTIQEIEKGIHETNSGLTPVIDGEIVRISIPPLSEERRLEYIKLVKTKIEAGKIMIRQVRQEAMKDAKKLEDEKTITEDMHKHLEKQIQEVTDKMVNELEEMEKKKETELLQV